MSWLGLHLGKCPAPLGHVLSHSRAQYQHRSRCARLRSGTEGQTLSKIRTQIKLKHIT